MDGRKRVTSKRKRVKKNEFTRRLIHQIHRAIKRMEPRLQSDSFLSAPSRDKVPCFIRGMNNDDVKRNCMNSTFQKTFNYRGIANLIEVMASII